MIKPKHIGLRVLVLVVQQSLCWDTTLSQPPAAVNLEEEIAKQKAIYQAKERRGGYKIDRSLEDYAFALAPQFKRSLAELGETDVGMRFSDRMSYASSQGHPHAHSPRLHRSLRPRAWH